jgi:hypothetical protein
VLARLERFDHFGATACLRLRQEGGWFLAAAVLTGFTVLVTLVFALVLKPDGAALKR